MPPDKGGGRRLRKNGGVRAHSQVYRKPRFVYRGGGGNEAPQKVEIGGRLPSAERCPHGRGPPGRIR